MICNQCPFGELVQIDSFLWMIQCSIEDCLMARHDECSIPDEIERSNYG